MSKSLKRHRFLESDDYSEHRIKAQKKREVRKKLEELDDDFMDDEDVSYMNDPKVYRAIKEYR